MIEKKRIRKIQVVLGKDVFLAFKESIVYGEGGILKC
jgi:hypothetical protein